jgi:hypothetical protein
MIEYIHIGKNGCGNVAILCDHVLQRGEVLKSKDFKKPNGDAIDPGEEQKCYSCGMHLQFRTDNIAVKPDATQMGAVKL